MLIEASFLVFSVGARCGEVGLEKVILENWLCPELRVFLPLYSITARMTHMRCCGRD